MGEIFKNILSLLPGLCVISLSLSTSMFIFSMNPDVKWNEYNIEAFPGFYAFYFHTLWSSVDAYAYDPTEGATGKYLPMLDLDAKNGLKFHNGSWKEPIRSALTKGVAIAGVSLLLLLIAVMINTITRQKLFVVFLQVLSIGAGATGAYFIINATNMYKEAIPKTLAGSSVGYYNPDKDEMKLGYNLAKYGSYVMFSECGMLLLNICLYIKFGDGKWIWQRQKKVGDESNKSANQKKRNNITQVEELA